ncbi:MAG: 3,4-dihydroxy-2-butanone-4-phosphate synthase [Gammaproteobacteria bacterium]|nr:3,4-dihydroxy-2-butanone-4-phosphate synthase [Gammaproteobacteria bacterium]
MNDEFDTIDEILAEIKAGRMVVIMDDADRENEGDLVMAAQAVRPDDINYMARFGRGLICLTLTRERCEQLRLPLMVSETDRNHGTNFTMSIEAAEGVTTGISAHDRAHTIRTAVAPEAGAEDLRQPGHVFPLMAQPGGVLTRAGHTEAGCDLARLAGMEPAAAIVEILKEDGSMARRDDLLAFAREHKLKIATIAQLIRYRLDHEDSVEIIRDLDVSTIHGKFRMVCLEDHISRTVHLALVYGEIRAEEPVMVRVHLQNTLGDVVGADWSNLGRPVDSAMRRIVEEGNGVVVVLRRHEDPSELIRIIDAGVSQDQRGDSGADEVLRTYGIGAQILCKLGVKKMRVLSAPKKMHGISGFGLEIVEYVE